MNTNDAFSSLDDLDQEVPPNLDLDEISMLARMATATTTKEFSFPWNMNLDMLATTDHFTLLQTTANQIFASHACSIESLGMSIKPHLRGPMAPVLILLMVVMVSVLVSAIVSIIQMALLAVAVVCFFPSVLAAIPSSAANLASAGNKGSNTNKHASRTPVAAFAVVLAASYAFSSIAALVVIASSAYAFMNQAAVASAKKSAPSRPDNTRSMWRGEPERAGSSMFRRLSRHRDSFSQPRGSFSRHRESI